MRVLVTGSSGFLGERIVHAVQGVHTPILTTRTRATASRFEQISLDLTDTASIARALDAARPEAVIHSAAIRDLSHAQREPELARVVNIDATRALCSWCAQHGARLIFLSTDQVFDGSRPWWKEDDTVNPLNVYGNTKAHAEEFIRRGEADATIARVALVFGHTKSGDRTPNEHIVSNLRAGRSVTMFQNEFRTCVWSEDVARAIVALLTQRRFPIVHVAGPDRSSRVEMGAAIARAYALPESLCIAGFHDASATGLVRALDTSLDTTILREKLGFSAAGLVEIATRVSQTKYEPVSY